LVNIFCESKARYCVYTHTLLGNFYNENQRRIHIEHGSFGIKRGSAEYNKNLARDSTYRVYTHPVKGIRARVCGLPRNDRLFDDKCETAEKLGISQFDKIIIWMPTFKHFKFKGMFHLKRNDFNVHKEYDITLQEDPAFYDEIDKVLSANNTLLIMKYHHGQNMRYVISKETANIKIIPDESLSDSGVALYSLLGAADALITDFSSVCYDYLLVDRPIGFDVIDLELYVQGGASYVTNPLDYMPGYKIYNTRDFCGFIESVAKGDDGFAEERKAMLDRVHTHQDNQSAKRVVELILE
jgi:CDP-glycerol glycerophosphotransferase (TagB/SpsB family)